MDRLGELEIFVAVVEAQSFTGAAQTLGVSKSHVSRQLQALEDRLGVQLLNRTTRTVVPTDAGAALHARANGILDALDEAERAVRSLHDAPIGTLRLSAPLSFGLRHVAPAIASFMQRWPELEVEISYTDRQVDIVGEGYDLAIRVGHLADSSLIARRLGYTRTLIVGAPAYLAARGAPDSPARLADHACLRYTHQLSGRTWVLTRGDGTEQPVRVDGPLLSDNGDALLTAARAGLGLAFVPDFFVCGDLQRGALVAVLDDWTRGRMPISALYPPSRHPSAKVRLFVEHLDAALQKDPWGAPEGDRRESEPAQAD
ncbi:MAG: LysR family transcriptional regulator [bacterium]